MPLVRLRHAEAARLTAESIRDQSGQILEHLSQSDGHLKVVEIAKNSVRTACREIYQMASSKPGCAGMGTTLTMLLVVEDKAILAHVGDSRLYMLRHGKLHQLSHDHTLANEMLQRGELRRDSEQMKRYSHVLTRSIGQQESVDVETLLFDILPGDFFLLCSDGLSEYFPNPQDLAGFFSSDHVAQIPERLAAYANQQGGRDNITSIVIYAESDQPPATRDAERQMESLGKAFLFNGLSLDRLMQIANVAKVQTFGPHEWLIRRGDARSGLYVVLDGSCLLTRPDGEALRLGPGDCCAETALARGGSFQIQLQSIDAVRVLHISRRAFRRIVMRHPKLGRRLLGNLLKHLSAQLDVVWAANGAVHDTGEWEPDELN